MINNTYGYSGYGPMHVFGIWSFFGGIMSILFWVLLIVLIVRLVRGKRGRWVHDWDLSRPHHSALEILKERYAKGEIDKTEFEAKKKDLLF